MKDQQTSSDSMTTAEERRRALEAFDKWMSHSQMAAYSPEYDPVNTIRQCLQQPDAGVLVEALEEIDHGITYGNPAISLGSASAYQVQRIAQKALSAYRGTKEGTK